MRSLKVGNEKNFLVFAIVVIIIVVLLIVCLKQVLGISKIIYTVDSDTFLYDNENNPIKVEEETIIQKKWNDNYFLKIKDKFTNLGSQVITYDTKKETTNIYGKIYRIFTDASVEKLNGHNEILDISEDKIYKLDDRKYLIVGSIITNDVSTLNTKNYLLVYLDKAGNTLLLNNELNLKTIKPITIKTKTFTFNVSNEKMIVNEVEIDLKKIIGSTNEYIEKVVPVVEDDKSDESIQNGPIQGSQNINNNKNNIETDSSDTYVELERNISIKPVSVGSSYVDITYNVQDPESRYETVYILVEGDITKTISLDKSLSNYKVTGLTPNVQYKLILGAKEINKIGERIDIISDIFYVRTLKVATELKIEKVTAGQIFFNFIMDLSYALDSADIVLYIDGKKEDTKKIDLDMFILNNNYKDSFNYTYGNEIVLRVENAKYNNTEIITNIEAKFKNY